MFRRQLLDPLKRWFADMRRRYFGRFGSGVAPPPPPPPPPPPTGVYAQYALFLRGF